MPVEIATPESTPSSKPSNMAANDVLFTANGETDVYTATPSQHYIEFHQRYSDLAGQDDVETFLFTSESVGEGHPGK